MDELKAEILGLEELLKQKKKKLFNLRLFKMYKSTNDAVAISETKSTNDAVAISETKSTSDNDPYDINIYVDPTDNTWCISYVHCTTSYDPTAYAYNDESADDSDTVISTKETKISFGKAKKYFIKGGIKLNLYRNSAGELRIINPDYEYDLDLNEQKSLVERYSKNKNIPEWLAIKVLLYVSNNKWDDKSIVKHFSVI